jgi:hypothetical protein
MKKIWYAIKSFWHFFVKHWYIFLSLITGIIVFIIVRSKKDRVNAKGKISKRVEKRIEKEETSARIEIEKIKAKTDKKIEELNDIKKESDEEKRLEALANFLSELED